MMQTTRYTHPQTSNSLGFFDATETSKFLSPVRFTCSETVSGIAAVSGDLNVITGIDNAAAAAAAAGAGAAATHHLHVLGPLAGKLDHATAARPVPPFCKTGSCKPAAHASLPKIAIQKAELESKGDRVARLAASSGSNHSREYSTCGRFEGRSQWK